MKRNGFTLAELLIVLGISGVIAAVILPAINGLMPDKTKINYLKVYDELSESIGELAADSSLFPVCIDNGNETIGCNDHPLINITKPVNKKFNSSNYEGNKKLCSLLAFTMNAESNTCSNSAYNFSENSFDSDFDSKKSFTTANGMEWWIVPVTNSAAGGNASYQTDIYVDVDSSKKSADCIFNATECKKPDRFKFMVSANGRVIPADPMGLMYVNTRKSFLKNKNEKAQGTVAANLDDQLKNFLYEPCVETHETIPDEPPNDPPDQACADITGPFEDYGGCDSSNDLNAIACVAHVYSQLGNTFAQATEKYGDPTNWNLTNIGTSGSIVDFPSSKALYEAMGKSIPVLKDCGSGTGCFTPGYYKYLDNRIWYDSLNSKPHRYKIITTDGISMAFQGYRTNCDARDTSITFCGIVYVDIDGPDKGPATFGIDLFQYLVTKDALLPSDPARNDCQSKGDWCTRHVVEKCNRAYLN